jgi:predicted acyltransferase
LTDEGKQKFIAPFAWFYEKCCKPLSDDPRNGSLMYALCFITFMWLLAWLMDKKKIYIKV